MQRYIYCIAVSLSCFLGGYCDADEADLDLDGDGQIETNEIGVFDDHPLIVNPAGLEFSNFKATLSIDAGFQESSTIRKGKTWGSSRSKQLTVLFGAEVKFGGGGSVRSSIQNTIGSVTNYGESESSEKSKVTSVAADAGRLSLIGQVRNPSLTSGVLLTYLPIQIFAGVDDNKELICDLTLPRSRYIERNSTQSMKIDVRGLSAEEIKKLLTQQAPLFVELGVPKLQVPAEKLDDPFVRANEVGRKCSQIVISDENSSQILYVARKDANGNSLTVGDAANLLQIDTNIYTCDLPLENALKVGKSVQFQRNKPKATNKVDHVPSSKINARLPIKIFPNVSSEWRGTVKNPSQDYINSLPFTFQTRATKRNGFADLDSPEVFRSKRVILIPAGYGLRLEQVLVSKIDGDFDAYNLSLAFVDELFPDFDPRTTDPKVWVPMAYLLLPPELVPKSSGYSAYSGDVLDRYRLRDLQDRAVTEFDAVEFDRYLLIIGRRNGKKSNYQNAEAEIQVRAKLIQ